MVSQIHDIPRLSLREPAAQGDFAHDEAVRLRCVLPDVLRRYGLSEEPQASLERSGQIPLVARIPMLRLGLVES